MTYLTKEQIESVIEWMDTWEQLKGTAIQIRFKEDYNLKLNNIKTYHKMEDLIIFRRTRGTKGQWKSHEKPCIKIEMPRGTFVIFKKVADLLNAGNHDAVMFAFNKKDKCAYIFKEEPEEDSYYLGNSGREYYRFTSKKLMCFFIDFFDIHNEKAVYFDVETIPNNKGMFKVVPSF